jgi:hypothetical protein
MKTAQTEPERQVPVQEARAQPELGPAAGQQPGPQLAGALWGPLLVQARQAPEQGRIRAAQV